MSKLEPPPNMRWDPTFVHARREAWIIFFVWLLALLWVIPLCVGWGYVDPESATSEVEMVWGIPAWLFWGVALPWVVADVATLGFCFFVMRDDDLEPAFPAKDQEAGSHGGRGDDGEPRV